RDLHARRPPRDRRGAPSECLLIGALELGVESPEKPRRENSRSQVDDRVCEGKEHESAPVGGESSFAHPRAGRATTWTAMLFAPVARATRHDGRRDGTRAGLWS